MDLKKIIREIPNYPEKGILFRDISTILSNPEAFTFTIKKLGKMITKRNPDYLAAIEARGFIFAAPLSQIFQIPLIMIRKKGKLPPPVIKIDYDLEYGKDTLEVSSFVIPKSKKILLIDDIIATGGTVNASIDLIKKTGNKVTAVICVIDLNLYKKPFSVPLESIIDY